MNLSEHTPLVSPHSLRTIHCETRLFTICIADGFLPANLFGDLPFYGALSVMYSMLSVVWMISCTLYV